MAEVLCVYREVAVLKESESARAACHHLLRREARHPGDRQHAPYLPPQPGTHATFARDHEYKRHGTLSCSPGSTCRQVAAIPVSKIDTARASSSPSSARLDAAYPANTAIRLILDNHSAHISKETKAWVAAQPEGRFAFVFTPKHGSWLNLIEGFFLPSWRAQCSAISVSHPCRLADLIGPGVNDRVTVEIPSR